MNKFILLFSQTQSRYCSQPCISSDQISGCVAGLEILFSCSRELTLFWSKLQQRVEPSIQVYLERCRQLSVLTKTVYHIFFLIKVINSEVRTILKEYFDGTLNGTVSRKINDSCF